MTYQESIKPLLECSFGIASSLFFRTWYINVIDIKLSKMCRNTVVLIHLRRIYVIVWSLYSTHTGKTPKQIFYDPSLTHKGGPGGKTDRLFRFSTYAFPIPLNKF